MLVVVFGISANEGRKNGALCIKIGSISILTVIAPTRMVFGMKAGKDTLNLSNSICKILLLSIIC